MNHPMKKLLTLTGVLLLLLALAAPAYAAAPEEGWIGGVDDGVALHFGDVVADDLDGHKISPFF